MSASLVGSEMCIRDRTDNEPALVDLRRAVAQRLGVQTVLESPPAYEPVSYTHLTLPTICSV
eukprot:824954-Alexandrium_andersonii.AAC.1